MGSTFENAMEEIDNAIERLAGLIDFSELGELEQYEAELLKTKGLQYLEKFEELETAGADEAA